MTLPLLPTRRALLKGACASLLLPLLPSLSWADDPRAPMPRPPRRWAAVIFPNGVWPADWWAKGTGAGMELSDSLAPLAPHRGSFSVVNDLHLFDKLHPEEGPHIPYFTNLLSGAHVPTGGRLVLAESCDQLLARTIGQDCFLPSLTLGIEPPAVGASIIDATMSWSSPTSPIPPIVSPRDAFDALFDLKGLVDEKSLLDCLVGDLREIDRQLSAEDARKLAEYTDTIRDLERRIDHAMHPPQGGWRPALTEPDMLRPAQNAEQALAQSPKVRHKLMLRILALALRMDRTRVATLLLGADGTYSSMGYIPGVTNTGWHTLAHHAAVEDSIRQYQRTNRYFVEHFAGFLDALKAVDEGGATLLDNSMVLFGSNVMDGNLHDADRLPLILAGKGGGTLTPGANLRFDALGDRRVCNLHLALLQRMGVAEDGKPIQRFGSSTKPLAGI